MPTRRTPIDRGRRVQITPAMVRCGSDYLRGQPEERALPLFLDTGFEGFEGVTRRPPVAGVSWCRGSSLFAVLVDSTNAAGTQSTSTPSASSGAAAGSAAGSAMLVFSGSCAISLSASFSATRAFNTSSLNRSRALAPGSPRLSATVAWIACASATSLAFARASALATLAASACARSVGVVFGVPRCLPPRLSPGFEPPPGMVSGYFCCQWLLAGI